MRDHDDDTQDTPDRKGAPISLGERASIIGLSLAGLSAREIARRTGRHRNAINAVLATDDAKDARALAKQTLAMKAAEYAAMHLQAAEIAAKKGDARPCEWALDRLGVVEPPRVQSGGGGLQVQIGVLLPGLPPPPNASAGGPLAIVLPATTEEPTA